MTRDRASSNKDDIMTTEAFQRLLSELPAPAEAFDDKVIALAADRYGLSAATVKWAINNQDAILEAAEAVSSESDACVFLHRAMEGLDVGLAAELAELPAGKASEVDEIVESTISKAAELLVDRINKLTAMPDEAGIDTSKPLTADQMAMWLGTALGDLVGYRAYQRELAIDALIRSASRDGHDLDLKDEEGLPEGVYAAVLAAVGERHTAPEPPSINSLEFEVGGLVIDLLTLDAVGSPQPPGEARRTLAACEAVRRAPVALPPAAELLLLLQETDALLRLGLPPDTESVNAAARAIWQADQLPHLGFALDAADAETGAAINDVAEALDVVEVIEEAKSSVKLSDSDLKDLDRTLVAGVGSHGGLPSDDETALIRAVEARRGLRGADELAAAGSLLTWDRLDPAVASRA